MGNRAAQNLENTEFPSKPPCSHNFSILLPKGLFFKDYPSNPRNFGERLRKARMDAGLQIKDLALMLGVTQDTVINWELRGMRPKTQRARTKVHEFIAGFNLIL